ncbi:hypothetical protein TIFTF001_001915 [Ficus carica]|uniref:Uncharacterized protein n=1 Tax=Ficus carica TaxID=3494 RepID=A0AA87ZJB7_FICCA|nr:hypothetical protein TIFTF001_001915 [Ficus carica]
MPLSTPCHSTVDASPATTSKILAPDDLTLAFATSKSSRSTAPIPHAIQASTPFVVTKQATMTHIALSLTCRKPRRPVIA